MRDLRIHLTIKTGLALLIWVAFSGCTTMPVATIRFEAFVGGEPLEFGKNYPSPNGDGTYMISDFKFYVSNIKLLSDDGSEVFVEEDSYHLVKFQNNSNIYSITLDSVSLASYDKISLSIGIDEEANLSSHIAGDLLPTNQMAWNWTSGYKFILLEGRYTPETSDKMIPLIYHIGFSENRRDLEFEITGSNEVRFAVEINELFENPSLIDFHTYPEILFNETQAAMMAANYGNSFITLNHFAIR